MRDPFEKVTSESVYSLINSINNYIRYSSAVTEYKNYYEGFEEVERFVINLGLVSIIGDDAKISDNLLEFSGELKDKKAFKRELAHFLLRGKTQYSNIANEFISRFDRKGDDYIYRPSNKSRLLYSGARNILFELGLLILLDNNTYSLDIEAILHECEYNGHRKFSPASLSKLLQIQLELGEQAEKLVLEFEISRLSKYPDLIKKIKQISNTDVSAGFDILSWEWSEIKQSAVPRYIEVKSVSITTMQFYWSRNEIEMSKKYKERYFLYLVPRINGKHNINKIHIIGDPYSDIFRNDRWCHNIESYSIWANIENLYKK